MKNFILRPWQPADVYAAAELATANVSRFMSDAFPGVNEAKWENYFQFISENPLAFYRVIEVDGNFAGNIGVMLGHDILQLNAELGYWIGDQYKNRGIMTEAVREMVQLVFSNFDVTRIYATPFGTNFASQRVLEKAGFKLEGVFEKTYLKNGIKHDEWIYAIRRNS